MRGRASGSKALGARGRKAHACGLLLLLLVVAACGDSPVQPEEPALEVEVVSAGWEEPEVGGSVPLVVRVTEGGLPVEGIEVRWEFAAGGGDGALSPGVAATDTEGRAETTWDVGTAAGERTIRVRVSGTDPVLLESNVRAGPAVTVQLAPDTLELTAWRERRGFEGSFRDEHGNVAAPPASAEWEVLDPGVVTLGSDGTFTAVDRGEARVAVHFGAVTDTAVVRVDPRGVITITFDDGFVSAYTRGAPILHELGLRANVAVNPAAVIEEWGDFASLEQLQELHEAGWAMPSHTMTHRNLTELTDEELEEELGESRAWIEEQGFRGAGVFVVPFHQWGERERAAVAEHYEMARGMSAIQFYPDTLAVWIPDDPYGLTAYEAEDAPLTTEEGRAVIREMVERSVEEGRFFELFFHRVPEEMEEGFRLTMEILAEYSEHVVTYDEVLEKFEGSRGGAVAAPPRVAERGRAQP